MQVLRNTEGHPFFLASYWLVVSNKEMAKAMVVFNMSLSPHVESTI